MQRRLQEESQSVPGESNESPIVRARIEAYLNRTCAPLSHMLPQEEVAEQYAEMRSHLESLVAAYIELGAPEIEAVAQALEQFGKEQSVARAWKQECETTQIEAGRGTFWSATRPVVGYSLLNWMLFPPLIKLYEVLVNGYGRHGVMPQWLMWVGLTVFFGQYTVFPASLGYLAGRRARGRVLGTAVLAIPSILTACTLLSFRLYQQIGWFVPPVGHHYQFDPIVALVPVCAYLGFGALGAGAARWRSKRTLRIASDR